MANVKITDLTALSASDVASVDVLPIVDINADQTKKITISDLTSAVAAANDFITFTQLNANLNVLDANADAIEARRVANVTLMNNEDIALQARLTTNVTTFTNEDTALQARITANNLVAASNDFITFTRLNSNINVVSGNVTAAETRLNANLDVIQDNVASVTVGTAADTETRLNANLNIVSSNSAGVEARRVANIAGAISTVLTADLTASRALVTNGSGKIAISDVTATELAHLDGVTGAIQGQIDSKIAITDSASNDFVTFTRLNANINAVSSNSAAVEARRVANIAGAVSTITTADLTADRALISTGAGKVGVSAVTATEIGHLDGVSGAIQSQLDAKAALAGATFTGQVNMSDDLVVTGNLVVNGDTTTSNSVNLIVQDRMVMLANSATGAPSADVGFLFNRGNQGNAAFFYDESASTFKLSDTKDPKSNTSLSPVSASNLDVGIITAATMTLDGASVATMISDNVSGAISTASKGNNMTAARALVSDASGKIAPSAVTSTEIGYLDGVSSAIQTQIDSKQATITGAATTIDDADLTADRAVISSGSGKVAVSAVTATEIGYLDGVSSAIQTQLDAKSTTSNAGALAAEDAALQSRLSTNVTAFTNEDTALQARITANNTATTAVETRRAANIAGAVSTITTSDLTASRAMVTNGSGKVAVSDVTATELGYLDGVSSAIQTQLNAKQATITGAATTIDDADLTASRALVSDGSGKVAVSAITSTELGFLDGITQNINANLAALALGIAGASTGDFPTGDYGLLDSANISTDAFGETTGGLTQFDMKTSPTGSVASEDLGALT